MEGKIFVLFLFVFIIQLHAAINEPKCFSSSDFQEKLLEKMVILTHKVDTLEHLFDKKLEELSEKANQLKDDRLAMESELVKIRTNLTNYIDTKMTTFERQKKSSWNETHQEIGDFLTETNLKQQRISLDVAAKMTNISADLNNNMEAKMTTFEKQQKNNFEKTTQKVGDFLTKTNLTLKRMSTDIFAMITHISADLNNMGTKMKTFEGQQKNNLEKTNQKVADFLTETNLKLQRISVDMSAMNTSSRGSLKPNVAFVARTVSDTSPGTNKQLVFTQTLVNTDDIYSTTTGYFTAPVEGTYLFSSQICSMQKKYVNFGIFVNNKRYSDIMQYDADTNNSCATLTTVAILKVGDRVCVKTGWNMSSSTVINQDSFIWSMFQGALVN